MSYQNPRSIYQHIFHDTIEEVNQHGIKDPFCQGMIAALAIMTSPYSPNRVLMEQEVAEEAERALATWKKPAPPPVPRKLKLKKGK